jgi:hypothetical protein
VSTRAVFGVAAAVTDGIEVRKNAWEVVRVRRTVFNGIELLDVRVFAEPPAGEGVPTRKGLTLRPETWQELLPAIRAALAGRGAA